MNAIRVIVICIFYHQGRILAVEGHDPADGRSWFRPIGGGVEFMETTEQALHREVGEEVSATLTDPRYLGHIENIFTYAGVDHHEIVFVYDATFTDPTLYEQGELIGNENGKTIKVVWNPLATYYQPDSPPLYPVGLKALLSEQGYV